MKRYGLVGLAGYIAPRHLKAIKDTGGELVAALDPNDSVGIIDSYFPDTHFFTEFERFDRHVDMLRRRSNSLDFLSICSPNYLHDAHVRMALRSGLDAICEKPLVINPWNLDALASIERETGRRVHPIYQFRLHPNIQALRDRVAESRSNVVFDVELTYIATRGRWYGVSWKGDPQKSGGVTLNIGVHFFDILQWVFGQKRQSVVHLSTPDTAAGYLEYDRARVRWFLSTNYDYVPTSAKAAGKRIIRRVEVDGEAVEFSEMMADLHTHAYAEIVAGRGLTIEDARPAIDAVYQIRTATPVRPDDNAHPFCRFVKDVK
jgi:UDP-N-acetyl-2-amino-2-deoxyglucuronate dehydrogenase